MIFHFTIYSTSYNYNNLDKIIFKINNQQLNNIGLITTKANVPFLTLIIKSQTANIIMINKLSMKNEILKSRVSAVI